MLVPGGWRVSRADQAGVWRLRSSPMQPLVRRTEVTQTWICHLYPVMAGHRADAAPGSSIQTGPAGDQQLGADVNQCVCVCGDARGLKRHPRRAEVLWVIPVSWKETRNAGGSARECGARAFAPAVSDMMRLQRELV